MAFPFPRSTTPDVDVYRVPGVCDRESLEKFYQRKLSKEVTVFKAQYLAIESDLIQSFRYVSPASANRQVFSINFGMLIKEAANLTELVCRRIYTQLYVCTPGQVRNLSIKNFLSLDVHLNFASELVDSRFFYDAFDRSPEVYQPFTALPAWDRSSLFPDNCIPTWWTAHNRLKHTNESLAQDATLENAMAAVAASFVAISCAYGMGVVYGHLIEYDGSIRGEVAPGLFTLRKHGVFDRHDIAK